VTDKYRAFLEEIGRHPVGCCLRVAGRAAGWSSAGSASRAAARALDDGHAERVRDIHGETAGYRLTDAGRAALAEVAP
jgi:hypothetical protein